jgi:hypothetical protein
MTGLSLLDSTTYYRISMNVPELPNVSPSATCQGSTSAIAYLLQAATELATEQDFQPTDENEMQQWMDRNSAAIVERARELQEALFDKFHEHRPTIAKIAAALDLGRSASSGYQLSSQQSD